MFRMLPFAGYFIGLVIPLFVLKDYWSQFSPLTATMISVGQGVALGSLLVFAFLNRDKAKLSLSTNGMLVAAPFLVWCAASSAWSINQSATAINTVILGFYIYAMTIFWRLPPKAVKATALFGGFATIAILLPLPIILTIKDRTLGGVSPNLLGHFAFLVLILFMINDRYKIPAAIISALVIFFVQARTVFVGLAAFWIVWLFLSRIMKIAGSRTNILIAASPVVILFGMIYAFTDINLVQLISSFMNVTSSSRLGSDFTGRADVWQVGYSKIRAKPLNGYGFKTRETADLSYITDAINAHSGLLNLTLDVGLIGLALFFIWYAYAFWQALDLRPHPLARQKVVIAAFLAGNLAILAVEPNYISFAHPTAFLTLLSLSFPLVDFNLVKESVPRRKARRKPQARGRYLRA